MVNVVELNVFISNNRGLVDGANERYRIIENKKSKRMIKDKVNGRISNTSATPNHSCCQTDTNTKTDQNHELPELSNTTDESAK